MMVPSSPSLLASATIILAVAVAASAQSPPDHQTSAPSLEGYVYSDRNGDGIYDPRNGDANNGVIDVTVEVRRCGDVEGDEETLASTITTWMPDTPPPYGTRLEGHSPVYQYGGYYAFDGEDGSELTKNGHCLLTESQISIIDSSLSQGNGELATSAGCYLAMRAPTDYEVTSTFPTQPDAAIRWSEAGSSNNANGNVFDDNDGTSGGITNITMGWSPHNDNVYNKHHSRVVNRGYGARTWQCFGYSEEKRAWYAWDANRREGGGVSFHSRDYYDSKLSLSSMKVPPLGMVSKSWPLDLRARCELYLGLEFLVGDNANSDTSDGTNQYVLLADGLEEGDDDGLHESRVGSAARFTFKSTSTTDARTLRWYLQSGDQVEDAGDVANEDSAQSNNTSTNYRHSNSHGLMPDTNVLGDILVGFLEEELKLYDSASLGLGRGQSLYEKLVGTWNNQWSMVDIVDRADQMSLRRTNADDLAARVNDNGLAALAAFTDLAGSKRRRRLRGVALSEFSNTVQPGSHNLRRGNSDAKHFQRQTLALPQPHLIFNVQISARYIEDKAPSDALSPAVEDAAQSTAVNFGKSLTMILNKRRYELIDKMRQRSGYGQECTPAGVGGASSASSSKTQIVEDEEYTEINVGVINRFDCDKLLPLYYFELNALAAREVGQLTTVDDTSSFDNNGYSSEVQRAEAEELRSLLPLFAVDDGYNGRYDESFSVEQTGTNPEGEDEEGMATWAIALISITTVLVIIAMIATLYVKREQKKLAEEKERRRLAKEAKLQRRLESEKRRSRGTVAKDGSKKKKKRRRDRIDDDHKGVDIEAGCGVEQEVTGSLQGDLDGDNAALDSEDDGGDVPTSLKDTSNRKSNVSKRSTFTNDSGDSELDRLFPSPVEEGESADEKDKDENDGAKKETHHRHMHHKKKKSSSSQASDNGSDANNHQESNASGLNHMNNRSDGAGADGNSHDVSTTMESSGAKSIEENIKVEDDEKGEANKKDSKTEKQSGRGGKKEPPRKIRLPKRGTMEKGISDLSERLTSSLRRSAKHKKMEGIYDEDASKSGDDGNERKGNRRTSRTKDKVRKENSKRAGKSSHAGKSDAEAGGRTKKRKPKLETPAAPELAKQSKKSANSKKTARPKRGISKAMSSMRMSVKRNLIGELSSSSESSSSSDESSDDHSSSSGDSSIDEMTRKQQQFTAERQQSLMEYEIDDRTEELPKKGPSEHDGHHYHEGQLPQQELNDKQRRRGSDRNKDLDNAELLDSILTQTNAYLPQVLGDQRNAEEKADESRQRQMGSKQSSQRSMGSKHSSRSGGSGSEQRSRHSSDLKSQKTGSRSHSDFNSSHLSTDFETSHQSLNSRGGSGRTSDFETSHQSLYSKSGRRKRGPTTKTRDRSSSKARKPKSKDHSTSDKPRSSCEGKKRRESRKTRPSLAQLKNSLTSSINSLTKTVSKTASEALEEPPLERHSADVGRPRSERSMKSDRPNDQGSKDKASSRRATTSARVLHTDRNEQKKKAKKSSGKDQDRPSKHKHHSKHKGESRRSSLPAGSKGTRMHGDDRGPLGAEKKKRRNTTEVDQRER